MALICYHASHEQFSPSHLLSLVQRAERAGFQGIHASDHFHPWSERQGQSGFTFSWIGAAMQATTLPFSMVCAPGQRLHPAIVAQAIATLCEMFPGRFNIELGSGEAINECITGTPWPAKEERNERLMECFHVIKRLLAGEEVNFDGSVHIRHARLYTLPRKQPALLCAAISEQTSSWAGDWADGLLTTAGSIEETQQKINSFRHNGGADKPVYVQFAFSYARDKVAALEGAYDQWRSNILPADQLSNYSRIHQFEEATQNITRQQLSDVVPIYANMEELYNQLQQYLQLDIDRLVLHNVNREQEAFIDDFSMIAAK
ncbi:MAG: TIGR03885 family FMN-dependent LLM class oxidoreductase [Agriterribacter sp.]